MTGLYIAPTTKYGIQPVTIQISGYGGNMYRITIRAPDGTTETIPQSGRFEDGYRISNSPDYGGSATINYTRDNWPLGKYTVTGELEDDTPAEGFFDVASDVLTIDYPSSVVQAQPFSWGISGARPGESFHINVTGPVNFTTPTYTIEDTRNYNSNPTKYDFAGTYQLQFVFTRSSTVTKTIEVTPKIYINYPPVANAGTPFTYDISGGERLETWSAQITGPSNSTVTGQINENGQATYSDAVFPDAGTYNIIWTFPVSGKIAKQINVIDVPLSNLEIKSGGDLSFSEIDAVFHEGTDMPVYQNHRWFLRNGDYGNFTYSDLDFYQFYSKRAIDPARSGSVYYYIPGHTTFTIPLHRGGVTIQVWGGGGGCGTSAKGADSIVNYPGNYMVAGGGTGSGGGARRYFSPGGEGGIASGGQENVNGNAGGNDMGAFVKGGTGATAPNGGAGGAGGTPYGVNPAPGSSPGGGSGGITWRDYSSSPGYGGAGGGGSGAYCATTVNLPTGTILDVTVGAGAQDKYAAGGDGAVKISWS